MIPHSQIVQQITSCIIQQVNGSTGWTPGGRHLSASLRAWLATLMWKGGTPQSLKVPSNPLHHTLIYNTVHHLRGTNPEMISQLIAKILVEKKNHWIPTPPTTIKWFPNTIGRGFDGRLKPKWCVQCAKALASLMFAHVMKKIFLALEKTHN